MSVRSMQIVFIFGQKVQNNHKKTEHVFLFNFELEDRSGGTISWRPVKNYFWQMILNGPICRK